MLDSIRQNFVAGGRPVTWQPLKKGGPSHLFQGGTLLRSISAFSGPTWAQAETGALPYAAIHQFSGWAGRGHKSFIPARPYMLFQQDDIEFAKDTIGSQAVNFINAHREAVNV
jgi:phage gpG-like protein